MDLSGQWYTARVDRADWSTVAFECLIELKRQVEIATNSTKVRNATLAEDAGLVIGVR